MFIIQQIRRVKSFTTIPVLTSIKIVKFLINLIAPDKLQNNYLYLVHHMNLSLKSGR
jgi:hypothetical protein